jgi:hypothetical protein
MRSPLLPSLALILLALLALLAMGAPRLMAADPIPAGFRGAHWGDPLAAIAVAAPDVLTERSADVVKGRCQLVGRDFRFDYLGKDGLLSRGVYIHDERHVDSNTYVGIFDALKAELSEKYGAPGSDQELWSNALFKGDRAKLGTALAVEAVVLRAQWDDGRNYIRLQAKGKDIDIAVTVTYGQLAELAAEQGGNGAHEDTPKL